MRLVSLSCDPNWTFSIDDHTMTIIEVDGIYTEPAEAEMIYISVAQRYTVLVTARNDTSTNFAITGSMDTVSLPILYVDACLT